MKTGILGGTFNPVHNAHLQIARTVLDRCGLDRVLFMPAAVPPHKEVASDVSFEHRLAMVELAIAEEHVFEASAFETRIPGASFSVETLHHFRKTHPGEDIFFIIGLDSFRDITTWKNYPVLFGLCNIVVARRPGPGADDPRSLLPVAIENEFCYDEKSLKLRHKSGHELTFVKETKVDISSTVIRDRVARDLPIDNDVPAPVVDYIEQNELYRKERG